MNIYNKPIKLNSERAWRTYLGGILLDKEKGIDTLAPTNFPEEWIASCTKAINPGRDHIVEGLSKLASEDITLKELIDNFPKEMLGEEHFKKNGTSLTILSKVIDTDERLTIQCHPTRSDALKYFNSDFGKTEAWYILEKEGEQEQSYIYLGFKNRIKEEHFQQMFFDQDIDAMLNSLNKIPVKGGDIFFIEGGIPHAIGKGCFLIEIQEPTDYTLRVEKETPSGLSIPDKLCHQGVGFENMFKMFNYNGSSKEDAIKNWKKSPKEVINNESYIEYNLIDKEYTECFIMKLAKITGTSTLIKRNTFYVLKVLNGSGEFKLNNDKFKVNKGDIYFMPYSMENIEVSGDFESILFLPFEKNI